VAEHAVRVVIAGVPVVHPLPDVAGHVEELAEVGREVSKLVFLV
jgi:hypothetical protein